MNEFSIENVQKFVEGAVEANQQAWSAQTEYFENLLKRNSEAFGSLAEARMESFKAMTESKSFNEALDTNLSFEDEVRKSLASLTERNSREWEELQSRLKDIYAPTAAIVEKAAKAPVMSKSEAIRKAPKKAAPKKAAAKKAAVKKATLKKSVAKPAAAKKPEIAKANASAK